jgi:multiple sugar transport system substrate-binding protein
MKHRRLPLVLAAVAVLSSSLGFVAASPPAGASSTVHLSYTLWDPHEEVGYKQSIALFEKAHPNISVTITEIPYGSYQTKLQEEFSSGTGPDLFWINTPWLSTWIKDGYMVNLAPYIKKWGLDMSIYYPSLVSLHEYQGAIYGLPKDWDTIAYFVNLNYLKQHNLTLPASWSWNTTNGGSFLKFLQEATIDTSGNNALSPKFNASSIATYGSAMNNSAQTGFENFWQMDGCHIINAAWASTTAFNTPACAATTQFIRDLMYKYHVFAPGSLLGTNGTSPSGQDTALFASGKIAMLQAGDWETTPVSQLVGTKFKIGVEELPAGPDGLWSVFNGLIDGVNPHSPNLSSALMLEEWLGSAASQKIMGEGGYIWPAIKSLDPLFVQAWAKLGIPMQPFLSEAQGNVVDWPNTPGMNQGLTDMASDMGPIWLGAGNLANTTSLLSKAYGDANHDLSAAGA